ncbi:MAG: PAS domain S-box protein [Candidatus Magnetomorum sp.]|nr:PAS domain S-box protein [Candidatus Magnetomorum sp.]
MIPDHQKPSYEMLEKRLSMAESIIEAIRNGEVDAIVRQKAVSLVRPEAQVRQTEAELKKSWALYQAVVEDQTELICRYRADGILTFVNKAFCDYFQQNDLEGKRFVMPGLPEDQEIYAHSFFQLRPETPMITVEHRVTINNEIRWLRWNRRCIVNDQGMITDYQDVGQDITQSKQTEKDLKEARKAAELADQSKNAFLANMSHELRTPLNGILGYAQLLEKMASGNSNKFIQGIVTCSEHLLTLINDILELSSIEPGTLNTAQEDFSVIDFVQQIESFARLQTQQKQLRFVPDISEHLPCHVKGDEKRLRQVLINLLGNAVKFTEKGQVLFQVMPLDKPFIRFLIKDTGSGIPKNQLETIFNMFQKASSQGQYVEGAGLGLTVCRRLIVMMNGTFHLESIINEGSTFWFDIPLNVLDSTSEKKDIVTDEPISERQISVPEKSDIDPLLQTAKMGNVLGVEKQLASFLNKFPEYSEWGEKILSYTQNFQMKALVAYLSGALIK